MHLRNALRHRAIIATLALSLSIALLIAVLVSRVTEFSSNVTEYYAPTIHAVKTFASATKHVKIGLEEKGTPDHSAVIHLEEATRMLKDLSGNWYPAYRTNMKIMVAEAERLITLLKTSGVSSAQLVPEVTTLQERALMHVRLHDKELENARSGIRRLALSIRLVALLLLVIGVVLTFREVRIRRLREQEQEKLSAIKAFVSALDAMTSSRPYRPGMTLEKALSELERNKGIQWSSDVVDPFFHCVRLGIINPSQPSV